jgi:hypothetical protein
MNEVVASSLKIHLPFLGSSTKEGKRKCSFSFPTNTGEEERR